MNVYHCRLPWEIGPADNTTRCSRLSKCCLPHAWHLSQTATMVLKWHSKWDKSCKWRKSTKPLQQKSSVLKRGTNHDHVSNWLLILRNYIWTPTIKFLERNFFSVSWLYSPEKGVCPLWVYGDIQSHHNMCISCISDIWSAINDKIQIVNVVICCPTLACNYSIKVAGVDSRATNRKWLNPVVQKWRYLSCY